MRFSVLAFAIVTGGAELMFGQSAAEDVGKANFRLYCAPCHGIHAQGGRGPDLRQSTADLFGVISRGVEGTEMRGYASQFDAPTINTMVTYLRAVALAAPQQSTGDAERGRAVFQGKGACGGCHAENGIGPSLARVGRQRSLDYIREKIVNPNLNITPGYQTLTVKLKDGTTVRGIRKSLDDFSVQLTDINRRFYSFRTEEAASIVPDTTSLMPALRLTDIELNDLVAYLSTMRGASTGPGTAAGPVSAHP